MLCDRPKDASKAVHSHPIGGTWYPSSAKADAALGLPPLQKVIVRLCVTQGQELFSINRASALSEILLADKCLGVSSASKSNSDTICRSNSPLHP